MPTLFDTLKAQLDKQPLVQQPQQQQVQNVLVAKTGKAAPAAGAPKASSLAESQTLGQNTAALQQQGIATQALATDATVAKSNLATDQRMFQTGQTAEAQQAAADLASRGTQVREQIGSRQAQAGQRIQADESMKTKQVAANASQKLKELSTERDLSIDDIFSEFGRSNKELEQRKDAAKLEQLGFLLALQDQDYLDTIKRVGEEQGMQDEVRFREEMTAITLGDRLSSTMDELGFKTAYNATGREYERALAQIDVNWALRFSEAAIADENRKAVVQGATSVGKEGIDAYAKRDEKGDRDTKESLEAQKYDDYQSSGTLS